MTAAVIIAACVIALIIAIKRRKRGRAEEECYYSPEALKNAYIANERRKQAEEDYLFFDNRVKDLNIMLSEAMTAEETARRKLEEVNQLNQNGAVINDKNAERARRDLYQQQRRRMTIENQLHAATRGRLKAYRTLTE